MDLKPCPFCDKCFNPSMCQYHGGIYFEQESFAHLFKNTSGNSDFEKFLKQCLEHEKNKE